MLLRALLVLIGVFFVGLAGTFLFDPVGQGGDFGLAAQGAQGLSTIRADFSAYFGVAGLALVIGGWAKKGDVLLVPAALLGITFTVRAVSLALDGTYEGWMAPMAVEAVVVIIALIGSRVFPHGALVPED